MDPILGIDLGTTNSAVSIIQDGKPVALCDERGRAILPSVVGLDSSGQLLVGQAARNQALVAPERTVRSIKRKMGQDVLLRMGEREYSPPEISAMILRTLAQRAERVCGRPLKQAVITVPAFFKEHQRQATQEAGGLAGLEVVRIINEPTAAALVYEPHSAQNERLLVYDLGGGTFDVSILQIEAGVVEVLASHGDTQLGGDDFDQLLLDMVATRFAEEHSVDLRQIPIAKSRLLQAVEAAKIQLSTEAFTTLAEEFIAERNGQPLNLRQEIDRLDYEQLIEPLLRKTLHCVDAALADAGLNASQLDRVVLVGGSTRTPLVHRLLMDQLHQELHREIDPDLCVSLGAAVQGALVAGIDVGQVLVDITPHTLGIQCVGDLYGHRSHQLFSPIIRRNTPLPASRSEIYYTASDGQVAAEIHVLQGEHEIATLNESIGRFRLEGLNEQAGSGNEILVRFELDLNGMLKVTARERDTGLSREVTLDNTITRFRAASTEEAKMRLAEVFDIDSSDAPGATTPLVAAADESPVIPSFAVAQEILAKARRLLAQAPDEDAQEMRPLISQLEQSLQMRQEDRAREICEQLDDLMFYLQDT
ncbi:MAG: Hsp70 family protein [Pirellulaceae bacterium]